MKPQFTPAQLARQDRWRHEEKFSLATTIISALMAFPLISLMFPGIIHIVAIAMQWIDYGLKINRGKILHDEQQAINAAKKDFLTKKSALVSQLSEYDTVKVVPFTAPTHIKFTANRETRVVDGSIVKARNIDTSLIKPTNVILNALKSRVNETATNIEQAHKR